MKKIKKLSFVIEKENIPWKYLNKNPKPAHFYAKYVYDAFTFYGHNFSATLSKVGSREGSPWTKYASFAKIHRNVVSIPLISGWFLGLAFSTVDYHDRA